MAFVAASLFFVPWEGWVFTATEGYPLKTWHVEARRGTIFAPPSGLLGANPRDSTYLAAMRTEPKMRAERLVMLWVAGGVLAGGAAWMTGRKTGAPRPLTVALTVSRPRPPESTVSPSPAPRGRLP